MNNKSQILQHKMKKKFTGINLGQNFNNTTQSSKSQVHPHKLRYLFFGISRLLILAEDERILRGRDSSALSLSLCFSSAWILESLDFLLSFFSDAMKGFS